MSNSTSSGASNNDSPAMARLVAALTRISLPGTPRNRDRPSAPTAGDTIFGFQHPKTILAASQHSIQPRLGVSKIFRRVVPLLDFADVPISPHAYWS
jgi:hypothetical protein